MPNCEGATMAEVLTHGNYEYHPNRAVCVTIVPPYDQPDYAIDPAIETKVIRMMDGLGPNCRVSKFQWLGRVDKVWVVLVSARW